jgi:VIT1/CCC1 family predicted Fe2+/Mn2+ transporter
MEIWENKAQNIYDELSKLYPEASEIKKDEIEHEYELINLLNDEKLKYAWAIVLWLNDALVELTGTLAWLSFAFSDSKVIGVIWIIMWVAASLSMASSGYLAAREEENEWINPLKAAIYTWITYMLTVIILVIPYFFIDNPIYSLLIMIFLALIIIALYNFYISIAKNEKFKKRFFEMVTISIWVSIISFVIWYITKKFFGIDI